MTGGPAGYEFMQPVETARVMLEQQRNTVHPVLVGNECIAFNVYWVKSGDDDLYYNGDGTTPSLTLNCDLPSGKENESDSKSYTDNLRLISVVDVDDALCNNLFQLEELSSTAIMKAMYRIRAALNVKLVSFLDSSKQSNLDTEVTSIDNGNGAWAVNADGATIEMPVADAQDEDALAWLDSVVVNNNMKDDYFLMNGRFNWYNNNYNADFRALNDDERNIAPTLAAHNMFFDKRDLDSTLTGKNTFAIDPNAYVFWNRVYSEGEAPVIRHSDNGAIWEFYLNDPMLTVLRPDGSRGPLQYEVVYQRVCQGRDSNTRHNDIHRYEVKLLGGYALAPAGAESETGVLKFSAVGV